MTKSNHVAYGSWIFGSVLLAFMLAVFWLAPDTLPPFKQQVLAYLSALLAGLFGFFLTGDIVLRMNHKESSTTLKAAGGIALFVLVLGWWQSSSAPVQAVTSANSGIEVQGNADIRTSHDAKTKLQTRTGQIQQGAAVNRTVEADKAPASVNSGISVGGDLEIESIGNGQTTIQTSN